MIYKIVYFILSSLSIFSICYSYQKPNYSSANNINSNYLDVYFTNASLNNTKLVTNKHSIIVDQINLKHPGDSKTIKYTGFNNTYNEDVEIEVYVNNYDNEYFTITTSDNMLVKSNSSFTGEINISLNKAVVENKKLDFIIELKVKRV